MIRGLEKIKSYEEYELAKKDLEYYINEYKWISDEGEAKDKPRDHKAEVEAELKECMKNLHFGLEQEDERNLLSRIQTLKTKHTLIANDKYKPALKTNINSLVIMLEEFEASHQGINFFDIVKGIAKGSQETKDYLRKKYMFTLSNMYGTTPAPESLNVESMDDILDYMERTYDFVDIDLSDRTRKDEIALVPYEEPITGIRAQLIDSMNREAEACISELKKSIKESGRQEEFSKNIEAEQNSISDIKLRSNKPKSVEVGSEKRQDEGEINK